MDVFVLMGERQSCEDEGSHGCVCVDGRKAELEDEDDQMDVFVLMGERQSCEDEGD